MKPKKKDFDIRQLEVFSAVVKNRGFSPAAKELSISQPTVSSHIETIERILDTKFFYRKGRTIELTPAGEHFYKYALKILALRKESKDSLNRFLKLVCGELLIGGSTIPGTYILPELIGLFREKYPGVETKLKIGDSQEIIDEVQKGNIELGAVGTKPEGKKLTTKKFWEDELVLIVPKNHKWAKENHTTLKKLCKEPFIMREKGSGTRKLMEKVLEQKKIASSDLNVVCTLGSTEAVKNGVINRIGLSILSEKAVELETKSGVLRKVDIKGAKFTRNFYLLNDSRRMKSPACEAFLKFAEKF